MFYYRTILSSLSMELESVYSWKLGHEKILLYESLKPELRTCSVGLPLDIFSVVSKFTDNFLLILSFCFKYNLKNNEIIYWSHLIIKWYNRIGISCSCLSCVRWSLNYVKLLCEQKFPCHVHWIKLLEEQSSHLFSHNSALNISALNKICNTNPFLKYIRYL